ISLRADGAASGDEQQVLTAVAGQQAETPNTDEKSEPPSAKKPAKKKSVEKVLRDLDELLKELPSAVDADQVKRLQEQLKQTEAEVEQGLEAFKEHEKFGGLDVFKDRFNVETMDPNLRQLLGHDMFIGQNEGRLGVQVQKPSSALTDQLDLPKG